MLAAKIDKTYTLTFPDPDDQRVKEFSETILQFANSIVILMTNNIITEEESRNVITMLLQMIGVDTTSEDPDSTSNKIVDNIAAAYKKLYGNNRTTKKS